MDDLSLSPKVIALFEKANRLVDKVKMGLSVQDEKSVIQFIATRAIPSTKLFIKCHKTTNEKGGSPTRLVIPATNFIKTFSKIRYLGIKIILNKAKVNYSRVSIFQ